MKRGEYKYSYMISQFRKHLSTIRSKHYTSDIFSSKIEKQLYMNRLMVNHLQILRECFIYT